MRGGSAEEGLPMIRGELSKCERPASRRRR